MPALLPLRRAVMCVMLCCVLHQDPLNNTQQKCRAAGQLHVSQKCCTCAGWSVFYSTTTGGTNPTCYTCAASATDLDGACNTCDAQSQIAVWSSSLIDTASLANGPLLR
jgi:hypothetical protein